MDTAAGAAHMNKLVKIMICSLAIRQVKKEKRFIQDTSHQNCITHFEGNTFLGIPIVVGISRNPLDTYIYIDQTWEKCGPRATYGPWAAPVQPADSFEHQNYL